MKNAVLSYILTTVQIIWQMAWRLRDMHVQLKFITIFHILGAGMCIWVVVGTLMASAIALNFILAYDAHTHITSSTTINAILMLGFYVPFAMENHRNQHVDVHKLRNLYIYSLQLARDFMLGDSQSSTHDAKHVIVSLKLFNTF